MACDTITRYIEDVRSGHTTCEEYVEKMLERTRRREPELHAYITLNKNVLEQARQADKMVSAGKPGILYGAPIAIKDNICVRGMPTTCASKMLSGYEPPYNATVTSRLLGQGAIITGKTNMDEFAMGLTTEFSAYGPSRNPRDERYVPGGSSGGSAAALAGNMCLGALGSDTGGSVRNPASFCGIVGLKPTYGILSRYGLVSYANSIEQIGPMTHTVKDAALLLDVMAGMDKNDGTSVCGAASYTEGIEGGIEGKKIGLIKQMTGDGLAPEVLSATRDAVSKLEGLGAICEEVDLESVKYSVAAYYTITATEAGSNLARYDNVRYGYDLDSSGYEFNAYISRARKKFGPEVTRRIILGGFVPSAGYAGKYYLKALKVRDRLSREVGTAFKKVDYMLSPTVPVLPFRFGEKIDDPVSLFLVDSNTVCANLTGRPAISVPYMVSGKLPIGMQLMADSMNDGPLLRAAHALESVSKIPEVIS